MDDIFLAIQKTKRPIGRPFIIAISGFGGSGKTTLAEKLHQHYKGSQVVSIDSFITGEWRRDADWSNFDRSRFARQVLEPASANQFPLTFAQELWPGNPQHVKTVPPTNFLIVEGCSILHPDLLRYYDFKIWVECPLEEATRRGMWRDRHVYKNEQDNYWQNVWMLNERDFFNKYRPDLAADATYSTT